MPRTRISSDPHPSSASRLRNTFSVKGKPVHTIKFEVAKDESTSLTLKLGQDSTAKKDLKGAEITVTFIDDNTFSLKDPFAKDPTKAQTLVFKRL